MTPFTEKSLSVQVFFFGAVQVILRMRGLLTLPILAHLIGAAGYGEIGALLALSGLVQHLVLLGSNSSLNVFIPGQSRDHASRDFWGIAQLTFLNGVISVALLIACYPYLQKAFLPSEMERGVFAIGIFMVPASAMQQILYAQIVNAQLGKYYVKIAGIASIIELLLLVAGAFMYGVKGALAAMLGAQIILCICMAKTVNRESAFVWLVPAHIARLKKYYTYGLTIFFAGLAAWAVDMSDRLIIGRFLSVEVLGIYQVAYHVSAQIKQIGAPLFAALMPFIVQAISNGDTDRAKRYLERAYKTLIFAFAPAILAISLSSRDILSLLTTEEFLDGAIIMPFVTSGVALFQISGVYTYALHAHKRGAIMTVSMGIAALLNIALNFLLIPRFGLLAASMTTLLAYVLHFAMVRHYAKKMLNFQLPAIFVAKITLACLCLYFVTLIVHWLVAPVALRLFLAIFAGGIVYVYAVYKSRAFSASEQNRLWSTAKNALSSLKST